MTNYIFQDTPLKNLQIIKNQVVTDKRGFLSRLFCQGAMSNILKEKRICQINKTLTIKKGTVRGLHFQYPPYAETKIISCLKGKVWDVAVDLRKNSPTFLNYHAELLEEDNHKSFLIPEGFAHGFQALSSECEMLYLHTADYKKDFEGAINITDPRVGINWPEKISEISDRDSNHPMLSEDFNGIEIL
tara:strand:- start:181 stop:744 length:564 start_codon:yes stop_codon:yes gene_type:complete